MAAAIVAWLSAIALRRDFSLDVSSIDILVRDLLVIGLLAVVVFELAGVHRAFWRFATAPDLATVALGAGLLALAATTALFVIDRLQAVPRSVPVLFALVLFVLLAGARIGWRLLSPHLTAARGGAAPLSAAFRPVLLIGAGEGAMLAIQLLRHAAGPVYRPVAILDERATIGRAIMGVPVMGRLDDLPRVLALLQVRGLRPVRLLATAGPASFPRDALRRLRERAYGERLRLDFLPDLIRLDMHPGDFGGRVPAVPAAGAPRARRAGPLAKRVFDAAFAALVLSLLAPLLAAIASAIAVSLGRPVVFRQVRCGRDLVPFDLLKFRTLADPVAADGRPLSEAERHTLLGRFLRRTRLDELPQFWNVLVGDMSIVGPRPLLQSELAELEDGGRARARVRPGITGWAQVNGGQLLSLREKEALDLWYIHHASLWLDLRILWLTALMMVRGERVNTAEVERALCARVPERAMAVAGVRP